jgi:hypothetical protein
LLAIYETHDRLVEQWNERNPQYMHQWPRPPIPPDDPLPKDLDKAELKAHAGRLREQFVKIEQEIITYHQNKGFIRQIQYLQSNGTIKEIILLLRAEAEMLGKERIQLPPFVPVRSVKHNYVRNLYEILPLQIRSASVSDIGITLQCGLFGTGRPSIDILASVSSPFSFFRKWLKNRTLIDHDANVHFPSMPLLVFRDYLLKGKTDRVFYTGRELERLILFDIHTSVIILRHLQKITSSQGAEILQTLLEKYELGSHWQSMIDMSKFTEDEMIKHLFKVTFLPDGHLRPADEQTRKRFLYAINDLEHAMKLWNKEYVRFKIYVDPSGGFKEFSLNLIFSEGKNVLQSFHGDYQYQSTFCSPHIKQKDILGIAVSREEEMRGGYHEGNWEVMKAYYLRNPLLLAMFSYRWAFLYHLKKSGCPKEVLEKLNSITQKLVLDKPDEEIPAAIQEEYSRDIYQDLVRYARQYLEEMSPFYTASNPREGAIQYAHQQGFPVWDLESGDLIKAP